MAAQPPPDRDVVREPASEREVVREPAPAPGGGGPWAVIAAIVGVVLVVLLIFFLIGQLGGGADTETGPDVEIEQPDVEAPDAPEGDDLDIDADLDAPEGGTDGGGGGTDGGEGGTDAGGDTN